MSDEVLFEIQRSLGRIEQKIDSHAATLTHHMAEDKDIARALFTRIENLQATAAQHKGAVKVWGLVATGAAALSGALVQFFRPH